MTKEEFISLLRKNQSDFAPVVPFDPVKEKLVPLDLSVSNSSLPASLDLYGPAFSSWINEILRKEAGRYGIGGYLELRKIYEMSDVFDAADPGEEPRRLHLGTDIWGKPHTPVMAPLDGLIHSFAFNNRVGDYGGTIILTHQLEGETFYTLYGHLSQNSLINKQKGVHIERGEVFAGLGIPAENGSWPPHLHFQIIRDIGDYQGDYPGVCKNSEKEKYAGNSPDPDLILQLNRFL